MADYEQAGSRYPDGLKVGMAATDKVGLWGVTPIVQPTLPAVLVPATDSTATISTAVNSLRTLMINAGFGKAA